MKPSFYAGGRLNNFRQIVLTYRADRAVLSLRTLLSLFALIATALLIAILHHLNQSVWWSVLFAWNPLVIIDTGAMPHVDIVGIVFVLLTILMLVKNRSLLAGIMLAVACGAEAASGDPVALVAARHLQKQPAPLAPARRPLAWRFRNLLRGHLHPPLAYQHGYRGFFHTLSEYSSRWEFNGSIYELIKSTFGEGDAGRAASARRARPVCSR